MALQNSLEIQSPEIMVLGAGPAACLAAMHLVRSGRSVVLAGRIDARPRIEGTSPRVLELLHAVGAESAAFSPLAQRKAHWGSMASAPNVESVVDRVRLDQDLIQLALECGVRVIEADITRIKGRQVITSAGSFHASRIIDARGRRASIARNAVRGPASIACAGFVGGTTALEPGTELLATPQGWCWIACLTDGRVWAQICIDAVAVSGGKSALTAAWTTFFAQTELQGSQWETLSSPQNLRVRACELRLNAPELDAHHLRIGDAAVAFDPLSGHGLFWALSSALMLPPMLDALEKGQDNLAQRFYQSRVNDTFWRQSRIARDFYALCNDWQHETYWSRRRCWPDDKPAHAILTEPSMGRKIVVENGSLKEMDVLLTPQEPDGVAFVMGYPITRILKKLRVVPMPKRHDFTQLDPQLSPDRAGMLHDWLVSRGLSVSCRLSQTHLAEVQP